MDDVDALRTFVSADPPTSRDFVGTDEEWEAFNDEAKRLWAERSPPDYKFEPTSDPRLWAEIPDTELHERASQILNAWDAYQADLDRYKVELDLERLNDFADELFDQLSELSTKLQTLKATTLDGIRAKARVLSTCWDTWRPEAETTDQKIIRSVLADLVGEWKSAETLADVTSADFTSLAPTAAADPIFSAIEAHKNALADFKAEVENHSVLENELRKERRESSITIWEERIIETDDPRWIAAERATFAKSDLVDEVAANLASVEPTTMAGVAALLKYFAAVEAIDGGAMWPDSLLDDDDRTLKGEASCGYFVARNVSRSLDRLGVAA